MQVFLLEKRLKFQYNIYITILKMIHMDLSAVNFSTVWLELLSLFILTLWFLKLRTGSFITSILLWVIWAFHSWNTVITTLFWFSISLFLVSNAFFAYLYLLSWVNRASYKAKMENSPRISSMYDSFSKILMAIWGIVGIWFVLAWIYYVWAWIIPNYIFMLEVIPLMVLSFFALREWFKLLKKIYYTNYVFDTDLSYIMKELNALKLDVFLDSINDNDAHELKTLNMPEFVLNRLRHRIPEKKINEHLDVVLEDNPLLEESLASTEWFIQNLNQIFWLYYHKDIYIHIMSWLNLEWIFESKELELYQARAMYMVYLAHVAWLYRQKRK